MRFITKINKLFLFLVVFAGMLLVVSAPKAAAATVYDQSQSATCDGAVKLTVPYTTTDGKNKYWCIKDIQDGDMAAANGPNCPFPGQASTPSYGGGVLCLVKAPTIGSTCADTESFGADCKVKPDCKDRPVTSQNCAIVGYIITTINVLSALVGLTIVIMIIVGGIQYSSAGDDPQKVQVAKSRITNALLALFIFIFMFSFLQWIVPGGIF